MPPPVERPEGKLTFLGLPLEIQQQVVGHMSRKDLFVFQRLSPNCLSLASAEVYRQLDLSLTNSGDEENNIANSRAADTLHAILASAQNYAKHIKSFRLEAIDDNIDYTAGHPARSDPLLMTRLLWDSKSDSSKFLNTALLLVARKTTQLETFQWDAPIEISGAVYQALHQIESLRHLQVRLDVSPSPKMVIRHGLPPNHHPPPGLTQSTQHTQHPPPPLGMASASSASYPSQSAMKYSNAKRKKTSGNGAYNYWANPRMFSGFKHLSTLSLMSMSNLDCLPEIAECIKASSATLKCLTLTLSTDLASRARKPTAVNHDMEDPSDTELDDDELLNDPVLPPATTVPPPPTNEADIRKEKLAQESILATIFDLQSVAVEGKKIEKKLLLSDQISSEKESEVVSRQVSTLMKSLLAEVASESGSAMNGASLEKFKMIKEVAEMYISNQNQQTKITKEQPKPPPPPTKKLGSKSKPLNPLASDFKASGIASQPAGAHDWDSYFSSSPVNPSFDGSPFVGSPGYPSSNIPNAGFLSMLSKSKPPSSQPIPKQKMPQWNPNAQSLPQIIQEAKQKQAEAYTSPYSASSHPPPLPPSPFYPYQPKSNKVTGLYDTSGSYNQNAASGNAYPSLNGLLSGSPPSPSEFNFQPQEGASNVLKKVKAKSQKSKKQLPAKGNSDDDFSYNMDAAIDAAAKSSPNATQPFFAVQPLSEPLEDAMDVDMEHPDEDAQESGEDQEILPEAEETDVPTPRKRAKTGSVGPRPPVIPAHDGIPSSSQGEAAMKVEAVTPEEEMQAYIRTTHGLHLELLALEWVPLKPSIVARALDLSVLKHLTLLEVGPQDAFWTLLTRLQGASPEILLKSIHTDNVSQPFVKFLATFAGLEELFMHERAAKQGDENAAPPVVGTTMIRKLALQQHISTLKRLMIRNERNESWDVDTKTLQLLAVKGTQLKELAVSLNMKTFHVLMQYFAAFKSLYALHLVALRSTDRNMALQSESLNFAVDSLSHCREMKIKYIAIVNSVVALETKPEQFKRYLATAMERQRDKKGKGKGKAPVDAFSSFLSDQFEDSASDEVEDALSEIMAGESKLRIPTGFSAAEDVKIFSRRIRGGRL